MAKQATREQLIKRGKWILNLQKFRHMLRFLRPGARRKPTGTEIFVDTQFGKVRALGYGLEDQNMTSIFFDLHGGGFILGNAEMDEPLNIAFHKQVGCKVISIEYAKAPDFPYPAAVNQVYAVVEHFFENAERYGIDRQKMAIGGHSAGGNLSAVTCMKARKAGKFQFVCQLLDYPPLDLATSPLDKPQPNGCIPPSMAQVFDACYVDPSQARDPYVSPVYADPQDLQGLPPALFILAGRDSLHDEGVKYREMLSAAGVETECYDFPDAVHGFTLTPSTNSTEACDRMAAFLKKHLR